MVGCSSVPCADTSKEIYAHQGEKQINGVQGPQVHLPLTDIALGLSRTGAKDMSN